jgi:tyrosyl-tRNA synthetase
MLEMAEVGALVEMHKRDKKERHAQKTLAREVTTLVHGAEEAAKAEKVAQALFGETGIAELSTDEAEILRASAPSCEVREGLAIVDALVVAKLASSKREARQFLEDNAVNLNGETITDTDRKLAPTDFYNGLALLKRGKKNISVLVQG